MNFLMVALGGALGATFRYLISLIPVKTLFPILTLVTNVLGGVFIGFVIGLSSKRSDFSDNMSLFLKTGVCGGFTTFSTFSAETLNLIENKHFILASMYIILSIFLCLLGVYIGKRLAELIN